MRPYHELEADVARMRAELDAFVPLMGMLARLEERAMHAEQLTRTLERRLRETDRIRGNLERELAAAREQPLQLERVSYRRGYETGYSAGKRGAKQNPDPRPRRRRLAAA